MENSRAEQERKELNKKLLKDTFISEYEDRKRVKFSEKFIDFIALFIAIALSKFIVEMLSINFWLVEIIIAVVLVMGIRYTEEIIVRTFGKGKN